MYGFNKTVSLRLIDWALYQILFKPTSLANLTNRFNQLRIPSRSSLDLISHHLFKLFKFTSMIYVSHVFTLISDCNSSARKRSERASSEMRQHVSSWEFRGASARPPNATGRIRWSSFGPWWLIKGTMSNRWRRFWDSEILEVSFQVVFCKDLTMVALLKMNMEEACGSFSSRMTAWQPYHMKRNSCWLQLCWNRTRTQPTNRIFCELTCSKQIWNISELIYR